MAKRNFKCDPDLFHCSASCCTSIYSHPTLSLGDYVRLSEGTKKPISEIWRSKGSIKLSTRKDLRNGEFLLTLGLLHNPCPYLSLDNKCSIHDIRPVACASFPLFLYINCPDQINDQYKDFDCLRGARAKPSHIKLGKELDRLMMKEAALELELLWEEGANYLYMPRVSDFFKLAKKAAIQQSLRYPHSNKERSKMMANAMNSMTTIEGPYSSKKSTGSCMEANLFCHHVTPFVFSLLEDEIGEKLEKQEDELKDVFGETSRKWRTLLKKMNEN